MQFKKGELREMKATGYKKHEVYRVDSFSDKKHNSFYFDSESEAVAYGKELSNKGSVVFLLEHVIDGKYDVVSEIK